MASKEISCVLFVFLFSLGSATHCSYPSDCGWSKTCCSDNVCRERCYYCTHSNQCGSDEVCCNNECTYSCAWGAGSIAGAIIGTIIFFAIIISIVACFYCACCPYYRYRTPGAVVVTQQPYQPFVSTHTHMAVTQQVQAPPPVNYNQPPPPYPSYPPPSTQHPPPQGQAQAGAMPAVLSAAQPVKY